MKQMPIAATCMHNLDWLYDIHTLPPHLQETKSWTSLHSSSHHLFITSTFTLQHLAPWRANARPKREAPRNPRLRAVWRLQCAPQAWIMIIIPIKWLFHWEYTLFSDKPINQIVFLVTDLSPLKAGWCWMYVTMVWWVWWYSACHGALVTRFVQDLPSLESDSAGDWGFQGESRLWK